MLGMFVASSNNYYQDFMVLGLYCDLSSVTENFERLILIGRKKKAKIN